MIETLPPLFPRVNLLKFYIRSVKKWLLIISITSFLDLVIADCVNSYFHVCADARGFVIQ